MENFNNCIHQDLCGGCSYRTIDYANQLELKDQFVKDCLLSNGISTDKYLGIKSCKVTKSYRNKMEYSFGDLVKGGELQLGLHEKGKFMNILNIDNCLLVPEDFNTIVSNTLSFCLKKGYVQYNKKTHEGLLRNLILRRGFRTNELLVNIVTTSKDFDENEYLSMIKSLKLQSNLVGVLHTINDLVSDAIVPEKINILYGRDYYNEVILGLKFKVGPFSFFQTNVDAAEKLYKDALALIPDIEGKTVFDLYCGTGTITQALSLKAKKVIGIEINKEAISTAIESSNINGLNNCEFIAEDVNKALDNVIDIPDVIVVDPPRAGIVPKAMEKILNYKVNEIVYISCNPKTMAINLKMALENGYEISSIKAYDNFPYTSHVECVVLLSKYS